MAGFVQLITFQTSRIEEVRALTEEFRATRGATGPGSPVRRGTFTADRDRPGQYVSIVEFESYEQAMANSQDPETGKFAARLAEMCDAPPTFANLDVQERWEG